MHAQPVAPLAVGDDAEMKQLLARSVSAMASPPRTSVYRQLG